MPNFSFKINKLIRLSFVILLFAATGANSVVDLRAQRAKESSIGVISILTRPTVNGTTVTLFADTALIRTQTWKDSEGFHIVLPNASESQIKKTPRGVQVRQVGRSLEILVRARPQTTVHVQPLFNRLMLFVNGDLDPTPSETFAQAATQEPCTFRTEGLGFNVQLPCDKLERPATASLAPIQTSPPLQAEQAEIAPSTAAVSSIVVAAPSVSNASGAMTPTDASSKYYPAPNFGVMAGEGGQGGGTDAAIAAASQSTASAQAYSINVPTVAYDDESDLPKAKVAVQTTAGGGLFAAIFSSEGAVAFLAPSMLLLVFLRRRSLTRHRDVETKSAAEENVAKPDAAGDPVGVGKTRDLKRHAGSRQTAKITKAQPPQPLVTSALELTLGGAQSNAGVSATAVAASLFGEDQIKQEVSMLVKGLPYRSDVVSSRAVTDRRVVEASLVEALNAPDLNGDDRARARQALEDNGFVLRRGAALLSAPEVAVRASAARALAEINSSASVPFLLEALNDTEATVRTEVLSSIGAMRIPAAIGALLEVAFRYPDTPVSLLGDVLSACSFEDPNKLKTWNRRSSTANDDNAAAQSKELALVSDVEELVPFPHIEELPESLDDENLNLALAQLADTDEDVRVSAARALAQFRVWRSVNALTALLASDSSAGVRAAAVTSLGYINHEAVFPPLLIAFADEARDVQAAAARSLSRLSIDRSVALVRLLETEDETVLRDVARACIKTGMVSKAVDKLTNPDRRQSYEAFLLLSLLARANETEAISNVVERCQDSNTRQAAAGLFGLTNLAQVNSPTV